MERHGSLLEMREEVLAQLEQADLDFCRVRMEAERMESDCRIGLPPRGDLAQTKGRVLPRAEARVLDLFSQLLKIEDKIRRSCGES